MLTIQDGYTISPDVAHRLNMSARCPTFSRDGTGMTSVNVTFDLGQQRLQQISFNSVLVCYDTGTGAQRVDDVQLLVN